MAAFILRSLCGRINDLFVRFHVSVFLSCASAMTYAMTGA
jgi:hypothetical protein